MSRVYFLKHKSEVFNVFVTFYNMLLAQFDTHIHMLRPNNGGEYFSLDMKNFINTYGLIHQSSCTDIPQQNGIEERKKSNSP